CHHPRTRYTHLNGDLRQETGPHPNPVGPSSFLLPSKPPLRLQGWLWGEEASLTTTTPEARMTDWLSAYLILSALVGVGYFIWASYQGADVRRPFSASC